MSPKHIVNGQNLDINKKRINLLLVKIQLGKCFGKFNWEGVVYWTQ